MERLWEFNQLKPSEGDKKVKYMKETFAEVTIGEHDREYFYRDEKSTGRISNKSGQISKI